MELSTAQTAILTFLRHYMSNLEYQYYESKNDFMRSYPYSVPYTAPRPEPMSYPDDDEFPLWAKQICYINNDHMHDEYVMDYISVSSAISAHEDAIASAQEELAESQAVARVKPIEAIVYGYLEFGDKSYNIQLTGLTPEDKMAIRVAVGSDDFPRNAHHFFQGDDGDWLMLEFWTQELSAISAACSIIIGAVGLTYEQVKGWEKIVPKSK